MRCVWILLIFLQFFTLSPSCLSLQQAQAVTLTVAQAFRVAFEFWQAAKEGTHGRLFQRPEECDGWVKTSFSSSLSSPTVVILSTYSVQPLSALVAKQGSCLLSRCFWHSIETLIFFLALALTSSRRVHVKYWSATRLFHTVTVVLISHTHTLFIRGTSPLIQPVPPHHGVNLLFLLQWEE